MTSDGVLVRDLMTPEPATLRPEDPLAVAKDVMRLGRIRHLPVVDERGHVVGIISNLDLAEALPHAAGKGPIDRGVLEKLTAAEVMTKDVITTTSVTPLRDAADQMQRLQIRCLPVVDQDRLVGVLTERDFVAALVGSSEDVPTSRPSEDATEDRAPDDGDVEPEGNEVGLEFIDREVEHMRALRDELRVQLRLAAMEAREECEEAERRWSRFERKVAKLHSDRKESPADLERIGRNFVKEMRLLYDDLRRQLLH